LQITLGEEMFAPDLLQWIGARAAASPMSSVQRHDYRDGTVATL
jgi:hypothetical protein